MLKTILKFLLILAGINCLSFMVTRIWWYTHGALTAEPIISVLETQDNPSENIYMIAGILNQPEAAFEFAKPYFSGKRQVYLQFKSIGWDARSTANAILHDAELNGDTASIICTISASEHVANYLHATDTVSTEFNFVSVNPCPTRAAVQKQWRWMLVAGAPLFEGVCHALGWLSVIPIIPTPGGNYSLILLADQFWTVTYDEAVIPPQVVASKVIISSEDELLDNDYLCDYLTGAEIVEISTHHGDTIGAAEYYAKGLEALGFDDKPSD